MHGIFDNIGESNEEHATKMDMVSLSFVTSRLCGSSLLDSGYAGLGEKHV